MPEPYVMALHGLNAYRETKVSLLGELPCVYVFYGREGKSWVVEPKRSFQSTGGHKRAAENELRMHHDATKLEVYLCQFDADGRVWLDTPSSFMVASAERRIPKRKLTPRTP